MDEYIARRELGLDTGLSLIRERLWLKNST